MGSTCIMSGLSLTGTYFPSEIPALLENCFVQFSGEMAAELIPVASALSCRRDEDFALEPGAAHIWVVKHEGASFCYAALLIYTIIWKQDIPGLRGLYYRS